jgi:prepilin-type processing-associated H-X9-DG protein
VRVDESSAQYAAAKIFLGHDMATVPDLNRFLNGYYGWGLTILNHNLWVKRDNSAPNPGDILPNTDLAVYGFPQKSSDTSGAHIPFMSDACFSGYDATKPGAGTTTADINISGANNLFVSGKSVKKTSGHVVKGGVQSVNMVFVDGHAVTHNKQEIQCVWFDAGQPAGFFY